MRKNPGNQEGRGLPLGAITALAGIATAILTTANKLPAWIQGMSVMMIIVGILIICCENRSKKG